MKGLINMRMTHDEVCVAIYEWMKTRNYNIAMTQKPIKVTQSRDRESFFVEFAKAEGRT